MTPLAGQLVRDLIVELEDRLTIATKPGKEFSRLSFMSSSSGSTAETMSGSKRHSGRLIHN